MIKIQEKTSLVVIPYKSFFFSGGEIQVKVDPTLVSNRDLVLLADLFSAGDVVEMILLVDALRRSGCGKLVLVCPYLPYARQDRVCAKGESLSLKVMCDIINLLKFESVTVLDAHSDVSLALLNNVRNLEQSFLYVSVRDCLREDPILVCPDAGALKKCLKTSFEHKLQMVRADKTRNPETGEITGTVVYSEHVGDKDFLIMDDICDGGRTFVELEKVLRPLTRGRVMLYVSHGIFSRGIEPLMCFDRVFVGNLFPNVDVSENDKVKVLL